MTAPQFYPGDTVRATREMYRGDIKAGDEGVFVRYGVFNNPWDTDRMTPCAVVDFPGRRAASVGLGVIHLVRPVTAEHPCSNHPRLTCMHESHGPAGLTPGSDTKARDLAHAHEKVAEAYKALAYALNDLKAVEAR